MTPQTSADAALRWLQYKASRHDANGSYFSGDVFPRDVRPRIEGNAVAFPFRKEEGYEPTDHLVFDEKGPPSRVVLDGQIGEFFK